MNEHYQLLFSGVTDQSPPKLDRGYGARVTL
jgi:hypothetical protein